MKEKVAGNPVTYAGEIGNIEDIRCKANMSKLISKKTCKNNCKHWIVIGKTKSGKHLKKGCELGYGYKRK